MTVEKREEDRLLHQLVNEFHGGVQRLRGRGRGRVGELEEAIADFTREVDLARGSGKDVRGQQAVPEHVQMAAFRRIRRGGDSVAHLTG